MEIYQNKVFDLFAADNEETQVRVKENTDRFEVPSTLRDLDSLEKISKEISNGLKQRRSRETKMNLNSSRSQAVFTISFELNGETIAWKLVDLAGTEHMESSAQKEETHLEETKSINKNSFFFNHFVNDYIKQKENCLSY